ncbi:MAG: Crp/Fnr family transcriptional regulator [Hyphomicrobiaceae bacterium]|nr:Crp/Fnr family transcriptional regulator [Hyphomicrobiaceae bacterium]
MASDIDRPPSNLLRALKEDDFRLIASGLSAEDRETGDLLYKPGDNVGKVYFPLGPSLVSYLVLTPHGKCVETILVGREGAVGGIVSSGFLPAYCLITVKYGGAFVTAPVAAIQDAKDRSATFRRLFTRYADCLMAQMFQATACNAVHSIEQRTAKWILAAMDRTGTRSVPMTHEQLATLMGVGRSYTSRVLQSFKTEGVLQTARGELIVKDEEALMKKSCDCNESVKAHFDSVLKGVYPD